MKKLLSLVLLTTFFAYSMEKEMLCIRVIGDNQTFDLQLLPNARVKDVKNEVAGLREYTPYMRQKNTKCFHALYTSPWTAHLILYQSEPLGDSLTIKNIIATYNSKLFELK